MPWTGRCRRYEAAVRGLTGRVVAAQSSSGWQPSRAAMSSALATASVSPRSARWAAWPEAAAMATLREFGGRGDLLAEAAGILEGRVRALIWGIGQ
jgi:pantoate kinase